MNTLDSRGEGEDYHGEGELASPDAAASLSEVVSSRAGSMGWLDWLISLYCVASFTFLAASMATRGSRN